MRFDIIHVRYTGKPWCWTSGAYWRGKKNPRALGVEVMRSYSADLCAFSASRATSLSTAAADWKIATNSFMALEVFRFLQHQRLAALVAGVEARGLFGMEGSGKLIAQRVERGA
jgi:hypothetical protein